MTINQFQPDQRNPRRDWQPPDNGSILVVEDTPSSLEVLSKLLTVHGYDVRRALDGPTALMLARTEPPDLILLDIMMPEMDGYEVCRQLKGEVGTRDIPIIFISALDEEVNKVQGFELGGVDYITKPFQSQEVLARVKAHLSLYKLQQELAQRNVELQHEITERQQAEETLAYQLAIEKLVVQHASRFINAGDDELDAEIDHFLQAVGEHINVDHVSVGLFDRDLTRVEQTFNWFAAGLQSTKAAVEGLPVDLVPWLMEKLDNFETIYCDNVAELPSLASSEKKGLEVLSVQAFVVMPLIGQDKLWGYFGYGSTQPRKWSPEALSVLETVGQVLAEVFERKRLEQELAELQAQIHILFEHSPLGVGLSTLEGQILAANKALLRMTGYSEAELLAVNMTDLYQNRDDRRQLLDQLQTDRSVHNFGVQLRRKDSTSFYASMNVSRLSQVGQDVLLAMIEDVTGQMELEEGLRTSKQRYEMATQVAKVGVWDWNLQSGDFYLDPNIKALLGYTDEEILNDINVWSGYIHPDDRQPVMEAAQAHLEGRTPEYTYEHRMLHKDGSVRWFLTRGTAIQSEHGYAIRMLGADTDITERKQVELALQSSQQFLQGTVDALTAHLAILDERGTILAVNSAWRRFAEENGLKWADYGLGRNYLAVAEAAVGDSVPGALGAAAGIREVMAGQQDEFSIEYPCHGPHEQRWFILHVSRFTSGGKVRLVTAHENISALKQVEAALQASETRFRTIWEIAADAMALSDADGIVTHANPAYFELYGYTPDEVIDQNFAIIFPPAEREWANTQYKAIFASHEIPPRVESLVRHADGSQRVVETRIDFLDEDGQRTAMLSIIRDITERKRAELELQELNDDLQKRVTELTALNIIAQTMTTVTDLQMALAIVAGTVTRLFKAYGTGIGLFNADHSELTLVSSFERGASKIPMVLADSGSQFESGEMVFPIGDASPIRRLLEEGQPTFISRAQTDPAATPIYGILRALDIHNLLLVPLRTPGEVFGLMAVATDQPEDDFSSDEESLAKTIAGQIAGAIKVARLFEEEQRQRHIAESLRQVATALSSSLDQQQVLNTIFEQLQRVLQYDGACVCLLDGEELVLSEAVGSSQHYLGQRIPLARETPLAQVFRNRQPLVITDLVDHPRWIEWDEQAAIRSWIGVPLLAGRSVIGLLTVDNGRVGAYSQEDAQMLQTFANQAAIAIENARLYEQAQTVAIDAERQRLARELHDSVTQSLYSLTLLTNGWATIARQGRLDAGQVAEHFKQLEEVSVQGLKEMRLLIHQLRPPILEEVGLVGALQQRLDTVEQRVSIQTRLLTQGEVEELPLALAEQLFFIAREALNNALRHARARAIVVHIQVEENRLVLSVEDDGVGFDPQTPAAGLGLVTMQERVETIGGKLAITSIPQQGTTVAVEVALGPDSEQYTHAFLGEQR